jgi:hypothetical protein
MKIDNSGNIIMKYSIASIYSLLLKSGYIVKELYRSRNKYRLIIFHPEKEITWEAILEEDKEDKISNICYVLQTDMLPADVLPPVQFDFLTDIKINKPIKWKKIKW